MEDIWDLPPDHPTIRLFYKNRDHVGTKFEVIDKIFDEFKDYIPVVDSGIAINNTNELNCEILITLIACLNSVDYMIPMIIFPKDKNVLEFLSYLEATYLERPRLRTIIKPIILSKYGTKRRVMNIFNTYHPDDTDVEIDEFNLFVTNTLQLRKFYTLEDFKGYLPNIVIVIGLHHNLVRQLRNKKSSLAKYNTKIEELYGRNVSITYVSLPLKFPLRQYPDDDTDTETE